MTYFDDVLEFHRIFHNPPVNNPIVLDSKKWAHRVKLISEEFAELCRDYANEDFVKWCDSLVDLTWVVLGTAVEAGIPFDEIWKEVKRANMDKRGAPLDKSGKLLKPPGWKPPDIDAILNKKFNNEVAGEHIHNWKGNGPYAKICSDCGAVRLS